MRLYTAANFAVAAVAKKSDECPYGTRAVYPTLTGVHFAADGSTVATNGHAVLTVSAPLANAADFPHSEGITTAVGSGGLPVAGPGLPEAELCYLLREPDFEFTLSAESVKAIQKAIPKRVAQPVLAHAALDETRTAANGSALFVTTDLATRREHEVKKLEGAYPKAPYCIPPRSDATFRVGFNLDNLIPFLQAVKAAAGKSNGGVVVEFSFAAPVNGMRIDGYNEDTMQSVTGTIMPADAGGVYHA